MEFYLSIDGEKRGPFSIFKVGERLEQGEIDGDTLAWHRDLEGWRPIREIPALGSVYTPDREAPGPSRQPPPPLPSEGGEGEPGARDPQPEEGSDRSGEAAAPLPELLDDDSRAESELSATLPAARPFARFWARMFDYSLVSVAVLLFTGLSVPEPAPGESFGEVFNRYLDQMRGPEGRRLATAQFFAMVLWHGVEAVLISYIGTTPGKALFGVAVLSRDRMRLPLSRSLGRSFFVFVLGVGLYQGILMIIAMTFGFFRLMARGECLWDKHLGSRVECKPLTTSRILLAVGAFLALLLLQSVKFS